MPEPVDEESAICSGEGTILSRGTDSNIDPLSARFPYCIVWTPLPVISWLAPYVGHMGICREDGVILDFAGPYFVNVDNFAFGATARYLQLKKLSCAISSELDDETTTSPDQSEVNGCLTWDDALRSSKQQFQHISYSLFTCNCHSFVARCLNLLTYKGQGNWNVVRVAFLIIFEGKWVSKGALVRCLTPFVFVMCLGIYFAGWTFLLFWGILNMALIGWFLVGTYLLQGLIRC